MAENRVKIEEKHIIPLMALTCLTLMGFPTLFPSPAAAPTRWSSFETLPCSHHPLVDAGTEPSGFFSLNGILNQELSNAWAWVPFFIGLKCNAVSLAIMTRDSQTVAWITASLCSGAKKLCFLFAIFQLPYRILPRWAGPGEQAGCDGPFADPGTFQPCIAARSARTAESVVTEEQIRLEVTCRCFGKAERWMTFWDSHFQEVVTNPSSLETFRLRLQIPSSANSLPSPPTHFL